MTQLATLRSTALLLFVAALASAPWAPAQQRSWNENKFLPSDGAAGDEFGNSVSLSGDHALIGAPFDDDRGTDSGSAYFYRYDPASGTWLENGKLRPDNPAQLDQFGWSTFLAGDLALVGALEDDDQGRDFGAAYLYSRDPVTSTWSRQQKLLPAGGSFGGDFGYSVALDGDLAVVGAREEDEGFFITTAGSAYVFRHDPVTASYLLDARLTPGDLDTDWDFGCSVSVSENRVLVGARDALSPQVAVGAAYLFEYSPSLGLWIETRKFERANGGYGDSFGDAVSVCGDLVVIGAPGVDRLGNSLAGLAYVYRHDSMTGTWTQEAELHPAVAQSGQRFGGSVSVRGDFALIGASGASLGPSAYLFQYDPQTLSWAEVQEYSATDRASNDSVRGSVSLDHGRAAMGAEWDDDNGGKSGSAYLFTPYLRSASTRLSAAAGMVEEYRIDFPASQATRSYSLLASASGNSGTLLPGGVTVPLSSDGLFNRMLFGPPFAAFPGQRGMLDPLGDAGATLNVPPGYAAGFVGRTLWIAAVSWEQTVSGWEARLSSHELSLFVVP